MRIWSKINHENVLAFLGFCFFPTPLQDGTTLLSLVSPWMKNGTVVSYIRQHPEVDRLDIIWGVLRGLKCLHGKGIVHGDIKGGNVFMTDQGTPVLADFGLASLAENEPSLNPTHESVTSRTTGNLRGSPRWMAPELLGTDSSPKSTFATDVWAYGCLILVRFLLRDLVHQLNVIRQ
ncbi:kinase-like protein [Sistotremastrum suecicum HHB10207 ss-3]|uniref:Kinase-like protein n=1 Tax=Sistotremastrum suecicum HHB10207 ss-3 TaxID=1314776 RepID=A0A166B531_9AGAM|nr:kinase-like protein [Sistotremastrum suecicum HHB10207 ss-3]